MVEAHARGRSSKVETLRKDHCPACQGDTHLVVFLCFLCFFLKSDAGEGVRFDDWEMHVISN